MKTLMRRVLATGIAAMVMTAVGCGGTTFRKFDLTVSLDEAYARGSGGAVTTVDVVALSGNRALSMDSVPMREYWTENDPYRQGLKNEGVLWTAELTSANPTATLSSRDRIWNSSLWKSGAQLYILADIPGVGPGRDGRDPRRLALPRDSKRWDSGRLDVQVNARGMVYSPQEKDLGQ